MYGRPRVIRIAGVSYVALATDRFDQMASFYGDAFGFPVVARWDRANARGRRFDLGGGLRLELLDNAREARPMSLGVSGDRFHVAVEVEDVDDARARLAIAAPAPRSTSWGARVFDLRDPDGNKITVMQWIETGTAP